MGDAEGLGNGHQALAGLAARQRLLPLRGRELELGAELHTAGHGELAPLRCAGDDQLTLELADRSLSYAQLGAPMPAITVTAIDEDSANQLRRFLRELRSERAVDRVVHYADGTSEFKLQLTAETAHLLFASDGE
jgi:hypothetical protein